MDQLPSLGRAISEIAVPTKEIYHPLLEAHKSEIEAVSRQSYQYGPEPHQELDIYSPTEPAPAVANISRPVLIFLYGGGFVNGDKVSEDWPLLYKNLGYFFTEKARMETIVVDYRLVKHGAKFPSGAADLDMALTWIDQRYGGLNRDAYILGNSAGAMNVATWLFEPTFQDNRRLFSAGSSGIRVSGVILLSALYDFRYSSTAFRQVLSLYMGQQLDEQSIVASLRRCEEAREMTSGQWPRMLVLDTELDPSDFQDSRRDFLAVTKEAGAFEVQYLNIPRHNHISPPLALGTEISEEEEWGHKLIKWINP